jgi:hypothetical protein
VALDVDPLRLDTASGVTWNLHRSVDAEVAPVRTAAGNAKWAAGDGELGEAFNKVGEMAARFVAAFAGDLLTYSDKLRFAATVYRRQEASVVAEAERSGSGGRQVAR